MAAAPELEGATGTYLHMNRPKRMDEKVYDAAAGRRLWERSAELVQRVYRLG